MVAKDSGFDPLTLAGVVSDDGLVSTTTELPIAMTFYTPYRTREGSQVLLTLAVGVKISVNVLLGMPFLKSIKATIDLEA